MSGARKVEVLFPEKQIAERVTALAGEIAAAKPKDRLAAGERTPFVARLAAPPPGVVDALVKFVAPGDKDSLAPEG